MAINLIIVVAFDINAVVPRTNTLPSSLGPTGNTMYMHKLHHGNTCV